MTTEQIQAAFIKYGSDKAQHGYAEFYAARLPENPKSILEIGVNDGASIRAWRELFPEAVIHGLDLFSDKPIPDIDGVTFWTGHQADYFLLEQLKNQNFTVIIDDGSHSSRHQMVTFFALFQPGQYYFIEDLHCCHNSFYRDGLPELLTADMLLQQTDFAFRDCQSPIIRIYANH